MGVSTLTRQKKRPRQGSTLWHNPTKRSVLIRIRDGKYDADRECEPGGEVNLPASMTDKVVKAMAPQLVRGASNGAPAKAAPPKPAPVEEPEPELGDGTNPRTVTDDDGAEVDSERTSDDALEAFAQDLEAKNNHAKLKGMAEDLGVAIGGRKIDIARRLAKKMAE